jgi:hypothetical protein
VGLGIRLPHFDYVSECRSGRAWLSGDIGSSWNGTPWSQPLAPVAPMTAIQLALATPRITTPPVTMVSTGGGACHRDRAGCAMRADKWGCKDGEESKASADPLHIHISR